MQDHVIVCGYGTKGRSAVDALLENGTPQDQIVVVERDGGAVRQAVADGLVVVEGSGHPVVDAAPRPGSARRGRSSSRRTPTTPRCSPR